MTMTINPKRILTVCMTIFCMGTCACNASFAKPDSNAAAPRTASVATVDAKSAPADNASLAKGKRGSSAATDSQRETASKLKFHPYEVIDTRQDGMVISRIAVPQNWKATGGAVWNYNDFYLPVHTYARVEAPDGSSWIEFFPAEFFLWLDPAHDRSPLGSGGIGGIHHPNITLPQALAQYVIAKNRSHARNLKILGYRPVNDLPRVFPKVFAQGAPQGEGLCMRVHYDLDGAPVDEEFYGFMTRETIPSGRIMEYHRVLMMVHSMGAKSGQLESSRKLLGFIATSIEPNPAWQARFAQIKKMQGDYYKQIMAKNYGEIRAAGERSRNLTEQSNQFMARIDQNLAQSRAQQNARSSSFSGSSNDDFYKRADDFDQNIRGTEHMQDQYGQVSDQYNDYNYHWTDGFGRYVHTDDPNLDPNQYLNGNYQQMTPTR
jgi:hypothetical protein